MTSRVIQGFFRGGRPRLPAATARPKAMTRPSGPPTPAFGGRPAVAQPQRANDAFQVDPRQLGLVNGGGHSLPDAVRNKMEAAFGADFSGVRVHVGPQAERIDALAFTVGSDLYFAPGQYQPNTVHGQQLLGHELAHVVQQRQGRVRNPTGAGVAVVRDWALEAEADRMGYSAAAHQVAVQAKMAPVLMSPPRPDGRGVHELDAGAAVRHSEPAMVRAKGRDRVGQRLVDSVARTGQQSSRKGTLTAQVEGSERPRSWYAGVAKVGVSDQGYTRGEAPISRVVVGTAQRRRDMPAYFAKSAIQRAAVMPGGSGGGGEKPFHDNKPSSHEDDNAPTIELLLTLAGYVARIANASHISAQDVGNDVMPKMSDLLGKAQNPIASLKLPASFPIVRIMGADTLEKAMWKLGAKCNNDMGRQVLGFIRTLLEGLGAKAEADSIRALLNKT